MLYDITIMNSIVHRVGLGDQECQENIFLLVVSALVSPSMYLAHSLVVFNRPEGSKTALMAAIIGINYLLNLIVFSCICQWFFSESDAIKKVLHGFLVDAGSLHSQETEEVTMFIKQIKLQHRLSVWGLFEVDTRFTATVILAATTHVAVLVQTGTTLY
ncbi:Phospholipase ABHD3 [Frankliniella fusca]|uniref:Phospholipase ABHD3 n=1 Tax=Frankliniella fusca TaxID=407009 RepID=A0AAE1GTA5_9NEOP|nr:Phospholipase ABHD3 [Frankliniella fusca]